MLFMGPLLAVTVGLGLFLTGSTADVAWTAGITLICALWWIFEPIPIPATSLLPLALLPLTGVLTPTQVGEAYGSPLILLLLGGFMLSTAMAIRFRNFSAISTLVLHCRSDIPQSGSGMLRARRMASRTTRLPISSSAASVTTASIAATSNATGLPMRCRASSLMRSAGETFTGR